MEIALELRVFTVTLKILNVLKGPLTVKLLKRMAEGKSSRLLRIKSGKINI